jgi:hypothetical protein
VLFILFLWSDQRTIHETTRNGAKSTILLRVLRDRFTWKTHPLKTRPCMETLLIRGGLFPGMKRADKSKAARFPAVPNLRLN